MEPLKRIVPLLAVLTWLGVLVLGCDRTDQLARPEASVGGQTTVLTSTGLSPQAVVQQSIRAYKKLSSYEDKAYVRLSYRLEGQAVVDRAPLSIAWDSSGRVGLRVYSVEAGPSSGRWQLRMAEADESPAETAFQHQILSREIPPQADFEWLLSDPVVVDRLAAGLAGFPPQLDLLLSQQPLSGLIDNSSTLTLESQRTVDDRSCHVVTITRGELEYRLWFDQATMLLRRVQIPNANLAPQILADKRLSDLQLTIELEEIKVDADVAWERFAVPQRAGDLLVHHFVVPPPLIDTSGLGAKIPAFTLNNPRGEPVYNSTDAAARKATVLVWLADHPACQIAAEQLATTAQALAAKGIGAQEVEFISVWAEPKPPQGMGFDDLIEKWKLPGRLTVDRAALGRDLFGVHEAPTLIVLDSQHRLQLRESTANPLLDQILPGLLAQLVAGVDLAADILARNETAAARYAAELSMATAVDGKRGPLPEHYLPVDCRLTEESRRQHAGLAVAATADPEQLLWVLLANGRLESRSASGKLAASFETPWKFPSAAEGGGPPHIFVAPAGVFVALSESDGARVQVFDTRTQQNTVLDLPGEARAVDLQWIHLAATESPRLAMVTADARTVLLDPNNREQLSGRCPAPPLAVIAYEGTAIGGLVVMADRSVERLELSNDSTLNQLPGRPAGHLNSKRAPPALPNKLGFAPSQGPWRSWQDESSKLVLARGWLAADEPAVFLLDESLNPIWHYRMPLTHERHARLMSVAKDPASGQPVFALNGPGRTIHLLRADGVASDHFRVAEEVIGIALIPRGHELLLSVVHGDATVTYSLQWNR